METTKNMAKKSRGRFEADDPYRNVLRGVEVLRMRDRGWTQKKIAGAMLISPGRVSQIESEWRKVLGKNGKGRNGK